MANFDLSKLNTESVRILTAMVTVVITWHWKQTCITSVVSVL